MYKDIFYWMYFHLKTMKREQYAPFYSALVCMIAFQAGNIFSVLFVIDLFPKLKLTKDVGLLVGLTLFILMALFNYLFVYRDRLKIAEIREQYTDQERQKSKRFFLNYIFSSVLLFIAAVIWA